MDTIVSSLTPASVVSNPAPTEHVPEFPNFTETGENGDRSLTMKECMVRVEKLSLIDMEAWLKNNDDLAPNMVGGHILRPRSKPLLNSGITNTGSRQARLGISYVMSSDTSDDNNDISVKPGKWNKPRKRNMYIPLGGSSST